MQQVVNVHQKQRQKSRPSHDAVYNMHKVAYDLEGFVKLSHDAVYNMHEVAYDLKGFVKLSHDAVYNMHKVAYDLKRFVKLSHDAVYIHSLSGQSQQYQYLKNNFGEN